MPPVVVSSIRPSQPSTARASSVPTSVIRKRKKRIRLKCFISVRLASPTPAPTCAVYAQSQRTFQDNEIVTSDPIFSGMQNMAFGTAIAYSGSILAVGAPHTTVGAPYDGAVFLFTCDESPGATTVECSSITPTLVPPTAPGSSSSMFGLGIALVNDGQNLVVTAPLFGCVVPFFPFHLSLFMYLPSAPCRSRPLTEPFSSTGPIPG